MTNSGTPGRGQRRPGGSTAYETDGGVGPAVTLGLFLAWALQDTEEVLAGPRWLRAHLPELRERWPQVPERVWRAVEGVDEREFTVAVGVMAAIVGTAAVAGRVSGGRSATYQTVLNGFGLHGLLHVGQALAVRGYTPGVATSPALVVPFTLWARRRLKRAGVLRPAGGRDAVAGIAGAVAATAVAHVVARRVIRR
ncbi:HXXEE domain-containing protein [Streptomyces sp. VRA16 Mangrove soil]|uniref:HXXEE domain-containing protein n=1 Tax=Streptomyces sp. VRA16 Mangrove soil TaxID=2817434 RepID=UPI001A9E5A40|nr:HXXEE domain-containing protein [Streptomyces sp. VRA16 Mangrove soil]MBO1335977.1 HXXEE domain-containing protein [Streptomyces sp. VRA16 Mangrove soil]